MTRARLFAAAVLSALGVGACQVVAGIEARPIDPKYLASATGGAAGAAGSSGASGVGGAGGSTSGASGTSAGKAGSGGGGAAGAAGSPSCPTGVSVVSGVRLANLLPDDAVVDFCAVPAGGSFEAATPLFHAAKACPAGLSYLDVSAAIALSPGTYDVRVEPAGAPCSAPPTSELAGVAIGTGVVTLVRAGGGGAPEQILARAEHIPGGVSSSEEVGFLHAMAGEGPLDFGSTKPALPSPLTATVGTGVPFGGTLTPTPAGVTPPLGVIDAQGYVSGPGYDVTFGIAKSGSSDAFSLIATPKNIYATIFAVGSTSDPAHPAQLLLCREDATTGPLAMCTRSLKNEIVIDAFGADLSGIVSPHEDDRRPYLQAALSQLSSDIVCLSEIGRQKDKDDLVAAAKLTMNVATFKYDESSVATNPADKSGAVPPTQTAPPCGAAQSAKVTALATCVSTHCSSTPGSSQGYVTDIDCVTKFCSGEYTAFFGNTPDQHCLLCLQAGVDGYTGIADFEKRCETDATPAYTLNGQGSVVMLSRLPFVKGSVQGYVLPSTLVRREVVKATVELGGGTMDVYCGILGEVYTVLVPYAGPYGDGATGPQGWANEQLLQAQRWLEWVAATSTSERVVLAGQMYASAESKNADGAIVVSGNLGAKTLALFEQSFPEPLGPGYVPACTRCTINPLVNQSVLGESPPGTWLTHLYAKGPPSMHVTGTERTFLDAVVPIPDGMGGVTQVPLSRNYGLRTRISLE